MNILSLDPANLCGWKTKFASGVINCVSRGYKSKGMKFIKFRAEVKKLIIDSGINIVVYEKPGGRFFSGVRSHANYEGVLLELCNELKVEFKEYSAGEIKKYATGKGNANKFDVMLSVMQRWNETPEDDNEADAIALYYLAKKDFNL